MSAETPATAINDAKSSTPSTGLDSLRAIPTKYVVLGCIAIGWLFSLLFWIFLMAGRFAGQLCMSAELAKDVTGMRVAFGDEVCFTLADDGTFKIEQGWVTFGKEKAFMSGLDMPMSGGAFASWLFLLFSVFGLNPAAIISMFKGTQKSTAGLLAALICFALIAFSALAAFELESRSMTFHFKPSMSWGSTLNVFALLFYAGALAVHLASAPDSTPTVVVKEIGQVGADEGNCVASSIP